LRKTEAVPRTSWLMAAAAVGFLAGVLVMVVLRDLPAGAAAPADSPVDTSTPNSQRPTPTPPTPKVEVRPTLKETPPPVAPPPPTVRATDTTPVISSDPIEDLRRRDLTLPVEGIRREELRDNFKEMRGGGTRPHEALDVLAPRHTPVLAVEDGKVARLFLSDAGGITIYQFDPTETYVYYYAHLERYAPGLKEGDRITRGRVIGHVGTTGNAPRDTPHLHFAIFKMTNEKKWWQGTAIDPYLILK
jgi:murein DD-endopeptidase MepM/ murein hydrolase activator NlpD